MQAGQQRLIVEIGVCVRAFVPVEHSHHLSHWMRPPAVGAHLMAGCVAHWRCVRTQVILLNREIVLVKTAVGCVHSTSIFVRETTWVLQDRRVTKRVSRIKIPSHIFMGLLNLKLHIQKVYVLWSLIRNALSRPRSSRVVFSTSLLSRGRCPVQ